MSNHDANAHNHGDDEREFDPGPADALRGHAFLPTPADRRAIPKLYATEAIPLRQKVLHLHYFVGGCDWFVAELDAHARLAFGWVNLADPLNAEWGYFDLAELRALTVQHPSGLPLVVERDLHWSPTLAIEVLP